MKWKFTDTTKPRCVMHESKNKRTKHIGFNCTIETYEAIQKYSKENNKSITDIGNDALILFLKKE